MIVFILFFIVLNYIVYRVIQCNKSLKFQWLFIISFFIIINIIVKCYNHFYINKGIDGFGFFILLLFSFCLPILNLINRNNRGILKSRLNKNSSILNFNLMFTKINFIMILTLIVTLFQIYMLLSGAVHELK